VKFAYQKINETKMAMCMWHYVSFSTNDNNEE
jgi:hypothetical protein